MNIFRYGGDISHMVAVVLLLVKLLYVRRQSAAGGAVD